MTTRSLPVLLLASLLLAPQSHAAGLRATWRPGMSESLAQTAAFELLGCVAPTACGPVGDSTWAPLARFDPAIACAGDPCAGTLAVLDPPPGFAVTYTLVLRAVDLGGAPGPPSNAVAITVTTAPPTTTTSSSATSTSSSSTTTTSSATSSSTATTSTSTTTSTSSSSSMTTVPGPPPAAFWPGSAAPTLARPDTAGTDRRRASRAVLPEPGVLAAVRIGLAGGPAAQAMRAVLYTDAGGVPGALLWTSDEVLVPRGAPPAFVPFHGPPLALDPGTYWLGDLSGAGCCATFYKAATGAFLAAGDNYADGPAGRWAPPLEPTQPGDLAIAADYLPVRDTTTTLLPRPTSTTLPAPTDLVVVPSATP
jgi:hypothetical protein